jgi:hypothetical protein
MGEIMKRIIVMLISVMDLGQEILETLFIDHLRAEKI